MKTWKPSRGSASVTEYRRAGLGVASASTLQAATALVAYFNANACTQDSVQEVTDFQNAWNGDNPSDTLAVDGEYGPLTQGALQNALGTTNVPANCFGGAVVIPPPGANPSPTPTIPNGINANQAAALPWILGGLVLVAGSFAAYTYSKKSPRARRR
jgi:hypothetical protein